MSERDLEQGYAYYQLGFETSDGDVFTTEWQTKREKHLEHTYDTLRNVEGVERVWLDYRERSLHHIDE